MWVYRHPINKLVLFDYRKGRGQSGHKERLSSFKGTIQFDVVVEYALGDIANWYALERKYRENGLSSQEKLLRRQEDIKPGFDAFKEWVETQHKNILTKGAISRALHYAYKQLPMIGPFFEDGRIHLDNNAVFPSCKEADVNPSAWMTDTLNRIGNHPINKISELLPSNFQKL